MSRSMYRPVGIPTDQSFLKQWFPWVRSKVSRRFKRDKERIPDTTQRVCVRLLQKEFIGRWFFKHLKEELVDRAQAERLLVKPEMREDGKVVLRPVKVEFVGAVKPRHGKRSDPNSLWCVSDLLAFAKFDHARFYYSMQNHTIDSDRVLVLMNKPAGSYSVLQSMWRQGRLLPAELTEHECPRRGLTGVSPSSCPECSRGLALLRSKRVTLDLTKYPSWDDPSIVAHVKKMRWNDSQLAPFLRRWGNSNNISGPPTRIMRPVCVPASLDHVLQRDLDAYVDEHFDELSDDVRPAGIDAGLLKYANTIVDNEVINDFKTLARTDDVGRMVLNNGMSPESSDAESIAFDPDSEEGAPRIICDSAALDEFNALERRSDISSLIEGASLTEDEKRALEAVDLMDMTVREYAQHANVPPQRVHRWRTSAMEKLRSARVGSSHADRIMDEVCFRFGCSRDQLLGQDVFGAAVRARTELFSNLSSAGMSEEDISSHFDYPRDRVAAAILRASRRPPPPDSIP